MRKLLRWPGRPTRRFWWRAMAPALVVGVCLSWALTAGAAQTTARAGQLGHDGQGSTAADDGRGSWRHPDHRAGSAAGDDGAGGVRQ